MKIRKSIKRGSLLLVGILFLLVVGMANAQIGIGTDTPHASALLDIGNENENENMGLLIPRMDLGDLSSAGPVNNPVESLLVYNTDSANTANNKANAGYYYWHNNAWTPINGPSKYLTTREGTKIGKKWTDNRDIFEIVMTGTSRSVTNNITSAVLNLSSPINSLTKVIDIRVLSRNNNVIYNSASYNVDVADNTATVTVNYGGLSATLASGEYDVIIQYLK